jgi:hypothetical protein
MTHILMINDTILNLSGDIVLTAGRDGMAVVVTTETINDRVEKTISTKYKHVQCFQVVGSKMLIKIEEEAESLEFMLGGGDSVRIYC